MKINTTLNRPNWLGDDVGGVYRTVTVTESTANYVVENGRKIIPSGTLIVAPYVSGLLLNDCDVTDGERVAQVLVRGAYIDSKLPTSVDGSRTILAQQGLYAIKYAETVISDSNTGSGGSGGLTPFKVGQTINGITIDPNAKSIDEVSDWLGGLQYEDEQNLVTIHTDENTFRKFITIPTNTTQIEILASDIVKVYYFSQPQNIEGISVERGWNLIDVAMQTITHITKPTTITVETEITSIENDFAFLNGTVVGAVEAESSGGGQ